MFLCPSRTCEILGPSVRTGQEVRKETSRSTSSFWGISLAPPPGLARVRYQRRMFTSGEVARCGFPSRQ